MVERRGGGEGKGFRKEGKEEERERVSGGPGGRRILCLVWSEGRGRRNEG